FLILGSPVQIRSGVFTFQSLTKHLSLFSQKNPTKNPTSNHACQLEDKLRLSWQWRSFSDRFLFRRKPLACFQPGWIEIDRPVEPAHQNPVRIGRDAQRAHVQAGAASDAAEDRQYFS